jgi:aromatic ring hydroxylase
LQNLSAALANPISEVEVARITQAVEDALKAWAQNTFRLFQQSTEEMQEVLLMAGTAAQQVGERDKRYTKRFTEFTERLQSTSKLTDVTAIRQSLGQHTADLKSYVAQMMKDSDGLPGFATGAKWNATSRLVSGRRKFLA